MYTIGLPVMILIQQHIFYIPQNYLLMKKILWEPDSNLKYADRF
jgi:hypothetical protein